MAYYSPKPIPMAAV